MRKIQELLSNRSVLRIGLALGLLLLLRQLWVSLGTVLRTGLPPLGGVPLALGLASGLVAQVLQASSWWMLLRSVGEEVPFVAVLRGYPRSFIARYIPGSVWAYLNRATWLRLDHNIRASTSWGCSVVETLGLVGTCLWPPLAWVVSTHAGDLALVLPLIALLVLVTLLPPVIVPRLPWFRGTFPKGIRFSTWLLVVAMDLLFWTCYGFAFLASLNATAASPSGNLFAAWWVAGLSWLAGFLIFPVPGGLGVRELAITLLLEGNRLLATPNPALVSVLFRVVWSFAELIWLGVGTLVRRSGQEVGRMGDGGG
ncbi:MAG: lysylphosphatidylglycerol synthase domain-containing protein [Anaerolineales bacterium]|jgi:hypothetical protein